jgi:hypothetical protein
MCLKFASDWCAKTVTGLRFSEVQYLLEQISVQGIILFKTITRIGF